MIGGSRSNRLVKLPDETVFLSTWTPSTQLASRMVSADLGSPELIREVFVGFQRYLYQVPTGA